MRVISISTLRPINNNLNKISFRGIKVPKPENTSAQEFVKQGVRPWATQILEEEARKMEQNIEQDASLRSQYDQIISKKDKLQYGTPTESYDGKDVYDAHIQITKQALPVLTQREDLADDIVRIAEGIGPKIKEADRIELEKRRQDRSLSLIEKNKVAISRKSGMSKVAGYEYEQGVLNKAFIDKIYEEKSGSEMDIPSSILFFGPNGNGKTYMTQAIADETGCHIVPVKLMSSTPQSQTKAMQKILDTAKEAEEKFQKDRTRTIIFIDEITKLTSNNSNVSQQFEEFLQICSKKYHCTVFAATNYPLKMALDFKNPDIFPIRVSIDPPDNQNAAKMFKHYLDGMTEGDIDYDVLASELIGHGNSKEGKYNNRQIRNICHTAQEKKGGTITQEDVLDFIKMLDENPVINKAMMEKFQQEYDTFIQD